MDQGVQEFPPRRSRMDRARVLAWLDAAGHAFLSSRGGIIAFWNLRVRDFACAQARATVSVHGQALTASVPRRRRSERPWLLGIQPHCDVHKERQFFDGVPLRYPYAKEPQNATRREGRFRARMIYAVIVQRLTRGCMIARVPEKVLSPGASSHQGRLAVGRVLGEDGFGTAHWGLSPRPEGSAGYRQLPIVAQRGCLCFARTVPSTSC